MAVIDNPFFARLFARIGARNEQRGNADLRAEMLAGVTGRVVEVGPGTGLNFAHYPASVYRVLAVEPERYLRAKATDAAAGAPVPIEVVDGTADAIPLPDGTADALAVSGLLCSVADPAAALAEFRRVLRPGGELRFYEHVRSRDPLRARWQDLAAGFWRRLMGGCMCNRDTLTAIRAAGFEVQAVRGLVFPPGARLSVVGPRILGVAVAPGG